jgi:hypothetical protein
MWNRDTVWFDVALILGIFAFGSVFFGRFEQHKPRWRRALKVAVMSAFFVVLAQTLGRAWSTGFLGLAATGAAVIHLWWLPKHGINGWTAEPYDEYLKLVTRRAHKGAGPSRESSDG